MMNNSSLKTHHNNFLTIHENRNPNLLTIHEKTKPYQKKRSSINFSCFGRPTYVPAVHPPVLL